VLIVPCPEITTTGSASLRGAAVPAPRAVHARHLHVEQDEVGRLPLGQRQPFLAGGRADELVAFVFQRHPQRVADGGFIIDNKNARS
jgi:hypothetical protein